ncbi:MAG: type II secretion system F family protein, partial [Blastocatellia bacterium]
MSSGRDKRKASREEIGLLATQLADRLSAGESFLTAILGQAKSTRNRLLRDGLYDVEQLLRNGSSAADAFRFRPDVFPEYLCHTINIGEI